MNDHGIFLLQLAALLFLATFHLSSVHAEANEGGRHRSVYAHRRIQGIIVTMVNTSIAGSIEQNGPFYLLYNHTLREVPDCFTVHRLGFECDRARRMSIDSMGNYSLSSPVPSFNLKQQNPDEYIRIELLRINSVQEHIVGKVEFLGDYVWHPSMCDFQNRTLLSARGPEPLGLEIPHFHWVDFINGTTRLSAPLQIDTRGYKFVGKEQVRMVRVSEDRIHMSFTVPNSFVYARMQTAQLLFNPQRGLFELTQPVYMYRAGVSHAQVQKNWVPFLYNAAIHFVYNIYPLTVLRLDYDYSSNASISNSSDPEIDLPTVSEEHCTEGLEQPWEYGHMRGGSPAQLVDGEYMSFFHSKSAPLDTGTGFALMSYWIGVYTFSASPPFRLTKISRYPIILDNWYDGVWFDKNNAYIVYPAGFQVVKVGGVSYVMVSFSLQDRRGYMGHIRLDTLMASLMPVNCSQSIAETEVENNVTVTSY